MVQKFCLSALVCLAFAVIVPVRASADFQLIKTERMQKELAPGWGQFSESNGQAIYNDDAQDTGVYYTWSVPKTLSSAGEAFEMSAANRKGKGYAEANISVEVNWDARIEGDLTPIKFKSEPNQETRQTRN